MGWLSGAAKKIKKAAKKLTLKKHGLGMLGLGAASLIPGVGGLLGQAIGTGGSGFMGGLFTKEGIKNAAMHYGKKEFNSHFGGLDVGGMLGMGLNNGQPVNPAEGQLPQSYQFTNPAFQQFNSQPQPPQMPNFASYMPDMSQAQRNMNLY